LGDGVALTGAAGCVAARVLREIHVLQDWAREQVWRICRLAGVPLVPHGLRGTLATMGKEPGETSQRVADARAHASTSMTERAPTLTEIGRGSGGRARVAGAEGGRR
jgi:integrase